MLGEKCLDAEIKYQYIGRYPFIRVVCKQGYWKSHNVTVYVLHIACRTLKAVFLALKTEKCIIVTFLQGTQGYNMDDGLSWVHNQIGLVK